MDIGRCDCGALVSARFLLHDCKMKSCVSCGQAYSVYRQEFRAGCKTCDKRYLAHRRASRAKAKV